ncbi:hypothetical protein [Chromobacterium haemolyticum]|uniref:hypothetical protein n=1 Tax=Chromobacterium haemolyticum TaxID=394935 RepID=UPI0009D9CB8E|nr:hypothetical protein [Chromobacterium haemolyticum]OQS33108.1 hypothetical protein B0T39_21380 [Chromobacterium haemolyticum]
MKINKWSFIVLALLSVGVKAEERPCVLTLSTPHLDYGVVPLAALREGFNQGTPGGGLEARILSLQAVCEQPKSLALRFNGPAADAASYRFGPQGAARLILRAATLDGRDAYFRVEGENDGERRRSTPLRPGQLVRVYPDSGSGAGQALQLELEVQPALPAGAAHSRERERWRMDGVFELQATVPGV